MRIICLALALSIAAPSVMHAAVLPQITVQYQGNGCSGGMSWFHRTFLGGPPAWEGCCNRHDRAYARGGTASSRARADQRLYACVERIEGWMTALFMVSIVRPLGQAVFPLNWNRIRRDHSAQWWYARAGAE
jgi:hypothetical protein